jgi:hypothetical protein
MLHDHGANIFYLAVERRFLKRRVGLLFNDLIGFVAQTCIGVSSHS